MDVYDKAMGLIGPIYPTEGDVDDKHFENLQTLCALIDDFLVDIEELVMAKDVWKFKVKRSSDFAKDFLDSLGDTSWRQANGAN